MADTKVPSKPSGGKKVPSPPNIEVPYDNERIFEYEKRVAAAQANLGSRYPPFSIEHLPIERSRLATPMTAEDRFLRRQFLADQVIGPGERALVPEAKPTNIIRRFYQIPGNMMEAGLRTFTNPPAARLARLSLTRGLMAIGVTVYGYYYLRYNSRDWDVAGSVNVYGSRIPRFPGDDPSNFPADPKKFNEKNFRRRQVLLD